MNHKLYRLIQLLLFISIVLGIFFRLYQFGQKPYGLNRDEAALGYNAYALGQEGVDEWGNSWPLVFKSFGDYKLPGYIYLLIPLIKIFGRHDWVVRLPSLLAGFALIPLAYMYLKEILSKASPSSNLQHAFKKLLPLLASAFVASSPWAIYYSRLGFEAHAALCLLVVALIQINKPFKLKSILTFSLSYLVSLLTYNTPLLLAPVIIITILLQIDKSIKQRSILALLTLVIASMGLLIFLPISRQKQNITIFSDPTIASFQRQAYSNSLTLWQKILHHRLTNYFSISSRNLAYSLQPHFLVTEGGSHPWHSLPNHKGHLSITVYLLFVISLVLFVTSLSKKPIDHKKLVHTINVFFLLFASTLPAIITVDAPHATRSLLMFFLICLQASLAISLLPKLKVELVLLVLVVIGSFQLIETIKYGYDYFLSPKNIQTDSWQGQFYKSVFANLHPSNEPVVFIAQSTSPDQQTNVNQDYIFTLYYSGLLPSQYLDSIDLIPVNNGEMIRVKKVGPYNFYNHSDQMPSHATIIVKPESNY